ncbi:MAG: CFI-box-CTERM domain-containing protein [Lachnospiraceae bacterium]
MNAYLTGIEGMPKLLDCCEDDPMQYFKKKTYADSFQKMYQQHITTFDAIEQGYNTVIDKEQFLSNMAEALAKYGTEKYNSCTKKSQKERYLMDMNLTMAVFVLPMILEFHGNSSVPLSEKVLAAWKQEFPKSTLQAAEYSYIEAGFHKKFCYITTAVCETFGKPDDCYELRLLRTYRDGYLAGTPGGEEMIRKYYDVAPSIVKHINQRPDRKEIYQSIWDEYLSPCIGLIESHQLEDCRVRYEDMVHTLAEKYFLS